MKKRRERCSRLFNTRIRWVCRPYGSRRAQVPESLSHYPQLRNYQEMFSAAVLPEAREGKWSPAMIDAVVLHGDSATRKRKVRPFMAVSGIR